MEIQEKELIQKSKSMNELKIQLKELESKQNVALMEYVHFKE